MLRLSRTAAKPIYLLLVGDSFTHSYAPFPDKWGTQIEKLLHYRVLKCGVTGYGTKQELLKASEIIAKVHHQPRLIIVGYFWNDLSDDYSFPSLTVIDGFLVDAAKYKDPKPSQLSKRKPGEAVYPLGAVVQRRLPLKFWREDQVLTWTST